MNVTPFQSSTRSSTYRNMTDIFLKQLKPLVYYCNLFSITYIVFAKTRSLFLQRAELFMGAPITLLYCFCVYTFGIELFAGNAFEISLISKIADPLEFITFVLTFFIKWIYYFFKRNETKQVIFEVLYLFRNCLFFSSFYVLGSKTASKQYI